MLTERKEGRKERRKEETKKRKINEF